MSMLIESASTIGEMASKKYRCCDWVSGANGLRELVGGQWSGRNDAETIGGNVRDFFVEDPDVRMAFQRLGNA